VDYYHLDALQRNESLPTGANIMNNMRYKGVMKKDHQLPQLYYKARENERHNLTLANIKMREIGGIPHLLDIAENSKIPNE